MMAESRDLTFVHIAGVEKDLFGLDAAGRVWVYDRDQGWWPCVMHNLASIPLGLTTVARTPDVR